ncbi:head-tail adaptor protein [Paracoccus aestuariivivens]|nr:head-tail adaptor protein [Paracoccus aestuariivivens]
MARLDQRIQFRRARIRDDGFSADRVWNAANPASDNHGPPVWAGVEFLSEAERAAAGWVEASRTCRFVIRSGAFSRGITATDRLVWRGAVYDIAGVHDLGRRNLLEITATARVD